MRPSTARCPRSTRAMPCLTASPMRVGRPSPLDDGKSVPATVKETRRTRQPRPGYGPAPNPLGDNPPAAGGQTARTRTTPAPTSPRGRLGIGSTWEEIGAGQGPLHGLTFCLTHTSQDARGCARSIRFSFFLSGLPMHDRLRAGSAFARAGAGCYLHLAYTRRHGRDAPAEHGTDRHIPPGPSLRPGTTTRPHKQKGISREEIAA